MLLATLLLIAVLLAWADSTVLRPLFPEPLQPPRRPGFRPSPPPSLHLLLPPARRGPFAEISDREVGGGLYTFWWFVSVGGGVLLATLAVLLTVPGRARRAAQQVVPASLPLMFAAGVATVLLGLALTFLLRVGFVLLSIAPFLAGIAAVGAIFGLAALALAAGRWLRARLGGVPPLLAALAALLVLFDVSMVPIAGWLVFAVIAVTALGLSVLTRMGSPVGWSLDELNW